MHKAARSNEAYVSQATDQSSKKMLTCLSYLFAPPPTAGRGGPLRRLQGFVQVFPNRQIASTHRLAALHTCLSCVRGL
jgi:hypothetical protein